LVRLKGERSDLENLSKLRHSPEVRIVEERGSFYLVPSEFNSLTSAKEVLERGRALIELINVVTKFNEDNFLGISEDAIIRMEDDGKRHGYLFLESSVKIRTKTRAKLTAIAADGSEIGTTSPSALESLFEVAQKNKVVYGALRFYRGSTWYSLYKTYETVSDDVKDEGDKTYQIVKKIAQISGLTCHNIVICKRNINYHRHAGSKRGNPPKRFLTLLQAQAIIRTILSRWISRGIFKNSE